VLGPDRQGNEGLRRVWWYTCKYENIDPRAPTRLPLLFALDSKLNIPNGFRYHHNCEELRKSRPGDTVAPAIYCGGDFSSTSYDGSTDGLSDTGASFSSDSNSGDSGSGDGGGDGGGGGCGGGGCGS
jgi:hypothetical protein